MHSVLSFHCLFIFFFYPPLCVDQAIECGPRKIKTTLFLQFPLYQLSLPQDSVGYMSLCGLLTYQLLEKILLLIMLLDWTIK